MTRYSRCIARSDKITCLKCMIKKRELTAALIGLFVRQKSLASYMKRFGFSNAKTEDLWKVISETSGVKVEKIMNMWTKQKGYPVITVKLKGTTCELEQVCFLKSRKGHCFTMKTGTVNLMLLCRFRPIFCLQHWILMLNG